MIIGRRAFFYQLGVDPRVSQFCSPQMNILFVMFLHAVLDTAY